MPLRVRPGGLLPVLQACSRPSTTTTRSYFANTSVVPPRRRTPPHLMLRTMSTSTSTSSTSAGPTTTGGSPAPAASTPPLPGATSSASPAGPPALPALPSPSPASLTTSGEQDATTTETTTIQVNGQPLALDKLGPMVVNRDGTVSRVANWQDMTAAERETTLRVLGKRNRLRLGQLRGEPGSSGS
ncbi:hypothetical protein N658DRAFT_495800 [Parathielavia hyrcaniae]|uniref:Uncharacterized protein n=1 Tax=Parathielavia hyrcaniae TaxID=113614 RepID=A0AAN6Q1M3_9PEZI|nr:hypothetical protein N658DRAFT_495800 [Parathielavia hyrcaniae]